MLITLSSKACFKPASRCSFPRTRLIDLRNKIRLIILDHCGFWLVIYKNLGIACKVIAEYYWQKPKHPSSSRLKRTKTNINIDE